MSRKSVAIAAFKKFDEERSRDPDSKPLPSKYFIRTIARMKYDFQAMRITICARLKMKADGTKQKGADDYLKNMPTSSYDRLSEALISVSAEEDNMDNELINWVESQPFYIDKMKSVLGLGPMMSAIILTEFDITKADTVSKLWAYAGLSPGMVHPYKMVEDPKGEKDPITKRVKKVPVLQENVLVRQDRLTPDYMSPFNNFLKSKLMGVLAPSFIKASSARYRGFYDQTKNRWMQSFGREVPNFKGEPKKMTKGWAQNRAYRFMMKMFLLDYYVEHRTYLGLPVTATYQEDKLGHVHSEGHPGEVAGWYNADIRLNKDPDPDFLDEDGNELDETAAPMSIGEDGLETMN